MEEYWNLMQGRICRKCIDGDGRGNCRLPAGESCALQEFLPRIVRTVRSVSAHSYRAYVDLLRSEICALCPEQDTHGVCRKRDQLECALDRYYPLVISLIEDVRTRPVATNR